MSAMLDLVLSYNRELKEGLRAIFEELNKGQTKKVLENKTVAKLVEKYHIEHK